jgi:hypothetical protein
MDDGREKLEEARKLLLEVAHRLEGRLGEEASATDALKQTVTVLGIVGELAIERNLMRDLLEEGISHLEELQGHSPSCHEYLRRARSVLEASRPVMER